MVMMPSGDCDMRVHSDSLNFVQVYFPFVKDKSMVDFTFVICCEQPIFSAPKFISLPQNHISHSLDSVTSSKHNVLVPSSGLLFHLFEVSITHSDPEIEFPFIPMMPFLEIPQKSIEPIFKLQDQNGVGGKLLQHYFLSFNKSEAG